MLSDMESPERRPPIARAHKVEENKKLASRLLRQGMTPAERVLWHVLRARPVVGLKWRRQQVVSGFVVDFYCASLRLVIELDGGHHCDSKDQERDAVLTALGLAILRLPNRDILSDMAGTLTRIEATCDALQSLTATSSPDRAIFGDGCLSGPPAAGVPLLHNGEGDRG